MKGLVDGVGGLSLEHVRVAAADGRAWCLWWCCWSLGWFGPVPQLPWQAAEGSLRPSANPAQLSIEAVTESANRLRSAHLRT